MTLRNTLTWSLWRTRRGAPLTRQVSKQWNWRALRIDDILPQGWMMSAWRHSTWAVTTTKATAARRDDLRAARCARRDDREAVSGRPFKEASVTPRASFRARPLCV